MLLHTTSSKFYNKETYRGSGLASLQQSGYGLSQGYPQLNPSRESGYGLLSVKEQVSDLAEIHRKKCWAAM